MASTQPPKDPARADSSAADPRDDADTPPLLGSWPRLYTLVLGELALTVLIFYALTRWAS